MKLFLDNLLIEKQTMVSKLQTSRTKIKSFQDDFSLSSEQMDEIFGVVLYCAEDDGVLTLWDVNNLCNGIDSAISSYHREHGKLVNRAKRFFSKSKGQTNR